MKTELITINTHLLRGQALNTNASFLAKELIALGIPVQQSVMLESDTEDLKQALRFAEERADLIILSGDLGSDGNAIAKMTLFDHLNIPLVIDQDADNDLLKDAIPLKNDTGLATGFFCSKNEKTYILLPESFDELKPMFIEKVRPLIIEKLLNNRKVITQIYSLYGLTLSEINEQLADLISYDGNPFVGVYDQNDETHIQITAQAHSEIEAKRLTNQVAEEVKKRVGDYIFGEDGTSLASVVKSLLRGHHKQITAAESLTGGSFLNVISEESKASEIFEGGIIAYSNDVKNNVLKVTPKTIDQYGVVSSQCAIEMAVNSMDMFDADISISLTGAAGPTSLEEKNPGTVWIGLAQKGKEPFAKKFHFAYNRDRNRWHAVLSALNLVCLALLEKPIDDIVFYDKNAK